jgi:hypothetical protein
MASKLLYLRIPLATWDRIIEEAEETHVSFAKAGIAILERGLDRREPVAKSSGSDIMV